MGHFAISLLSWPDFSRLALCSCLCPLSPWSWGLQVRRHGSSLCITNVCFQIFCWLETVFSFIACHVDIERIMLLIQNLCPVVLLSHFLSFPQSWPALCALLKQKHLVTYIWQLCWNVWDWQELFAKYLWLHIKLQSRHLVHGDNVYLNVTTFTQVPFVFVEVLDTSKILW